MHASLSYDSCTPVCLASSLLQSEAVLVAFLAGEEMKAAVLKQARCTAATFTGTAFQVFIVNQQSPQGESIIHTPMYLPPVFRFFFCAGKLFQPVPYSPGTPHGMPAAFEPFYDNPQVSLDYGNTRRDRQPVQALPFSFLGLGFTPKPIVSPAFRCHDDDHHQSTTVRHLPRAPARHVQGPHFYAPAPVRCLRDRRYGLRDL